MNADLLEVLACPTCHSTALRVETLKGSARAVREGVVWCERRHWFPVEDRVLEFLPPGLHYGADRKAFSRRRAGELKALDLLEEEPPTGETRRADELKAIEAQKTHFDWYADNDRQAYTRYAAMPFWEIVDQRTSSAWNAKIRDELGTGGGPKRLLDVGCAQGRSALMIWPSGARILGFDVSKRMVQQAYANLATLDGEESRHDFIVADGSRFPFRSSAFDYVLVYGVLHHLPDPATACHEIARVLKRGGTYFGSENNQTVLRGAFDLLQRLRPIWYEEAGAEPLIGASDLGRWFSATDVTLRTSATVFAPPHLVNVLGRRAGRLLLAWTDAVCHVIPFLRGQGGLILVEGTKR